MKRQEKNRTRHLNVGIKLTEGEQEKFRSICKELNITKLQFLLDRLKEYEDIIK